MDMASTSKQDVIQDSSFLVKLPVEVRHQIYQLILGGKVIPIMITGGGVLLRHCVCPLEGQKFHFLMYKTEDGSWCTCGSHDKVPDSPKRLPLLLTCRQIYSESVDILWSHNIIHLQTISSREFHILSDLRAALPPRSFHAIRSLEISFLHGSICRVIQTLDEEWFDQWTRMWKVIKLMSRIVYIQAWVKMDQEIGNMMTIDQEAKLFAPLMGLIIRDFKVEVTWPANEGSEALLLQAPFRVARNSDPIPNKPEFAVEVVNGSLRSQADNIRYRSLVATSHLTTI